MAPGRSHRGSEKKPLRCTRHGGESQCRSFKVALSLARNLTRSRTSARDCDPVRLCELDAAALQFSAMARASRRLFCASAMRPPWCHPSAVLASSRIRFRLLRDVQGLAMNTCMLQPLSAAWLGCACLLGAPTVAVLHHTAACGAMLGSFLILARLLQVLDAVPQHKGHTFWLKSFRAVRQIQAWLLVAEDTATHVNTNGQTPTAGPFLWRPPVYRASPC